MESKNSWVTTSKELQCVKNMPKLKHRNPEKEFDIRDSEVVQWLISQPTVLNYLFDIVRGRDKRRESLIEFDKATGTWQGVDYNGD